MNKHNELIAKEGWVFLFPMVALSLLAVLFFNAWGWAAFFGILAFYIAWFFRNPYRQIPEDPSAIVSPADGKVVLVRQLEDGRHMICIFLNIFNVHVNRCPVGGTVEEIEYTKGKFVAADKEEASQINERNRLVIRDGDFVMEVTQVAGLVARRIVCWAQKAQQVARGERFGLIRFGSRTDIILPAECQVVVQVGQKVAGGSHIIARRPA